MPHCPAAAAAVLADALPPNASACEAPAKRLCCLASPPTAALALSHAPSCASWRLWRCCSSTLQWGMTQRRRRACSPGRLCGSWWTRHTRWEEQGLAGWGASGRQALPGRAYTSLQGLGCGPCCVGCVGCVECKTSHHSNWWGSVVLGRPVVHSALPSTAFHTCSLCPLQLRQVQATYVKPETGRLMLVLHVSRSSQCKVPPAFHMLPLVVRRQGRLRVSLTQHATSISLAHDQPLFNLGP